ncbi:MAG: Omp28-related outer membrane protein [Crocinitomicaceae bacterium]
MKKLLLCTSLLLVGSAFGQYSEDFEGTTGTALPSGWTQVTAATDGGYLSGTDMSSQYFPIPAHTRYVGTNDDACDCDKANEKLISTSFIVPTNGILSFEYVLPGGYGETAEVGISTDGGTTSTQVITLAPAGDWTTASANISSYAGQTVNIVWNYNDQGVWAYGLMLDDVDVFTPATVDMEMTALTTISTVVAGNAAITGTVTSFGADVVNSIEVTWDDGSGSNSATFPVSLNYGDTYNFTHTTPLVAAGGMTYNLNVCVVANSDADPSNNCISGIVSAVSALVPKVTVGEEKTGEWCGWCPRGAVALANMSLSNPSDFIGIAVHNGDAMTVSSYDGGIGEYVPGGYPGGGVDRVESGDPGNFLAMHNARASMIPPASVSVNSEINGSTATVTVSADFVGALSGDYRLAVVLIEDAVSGSGQGNYYNDGQSGAMAFPNTGSMPNFNFVGGGATVTPVLHDHVARALGSNQINGAPGSLPNSISSGSNHTHTYTFPINSSWSPWKMHAVGMLVNGTTGEILNAGITSGVLGLNDLAENNFNVSAIPNPTNGVSNIMVDLDIAAEMSIVVVDILGNVVYNMASTEITAGSYKASVDLSNNANGVYFAQVVLNDTVKTVKIIVEK